MNLSDSQAILKWFWSESLWFANHSEMILEWIFVICKPFWNDSAVNLSDLWTILKWFSSKSLWFANHSEMILESWQISVNCVPFWNDFEAKLGKSWILKHSKMILEWILANLGDLQTILKWFLSEALWFANHSEMILQWISVICELFWNDSQANLCGLWTILKWFLTSWVNLGKSQWICEPFWNDFEAKLGKSWWILKHSKMILEWILVICKPF